MATVGAVWRKVQQRLVAGGLGPAPREGMALVGQVLGCAWGDLVLREGEIFGGDLAVLEEMVQRRLGGVPLGYVLGGAWVAGRWWAVGRGVLIPRMDTEVLIEEAKKRVRAGMRVAEVGVGSGVVLGSIGADVAGLELVGTDVSVDALLCANGNLTRYGVRAKLVQTNMLDGVEELDMVVSNPPYIGEDEWAALEPVVRDHEPRVALVGGGAGHEIYADLIRAAAAKLCNGGWLGLEMGWQQAPAVLNYLPTTEWMDVCVVQDLAGRDRNIWARRR